MLATWTLKPDPWAVAIGEPGQFNGTRVAQPSAGALIGKKEMP